MKCGWPIQFWIHVGDDITYEWDFNVISPVWVSDTSSSDVVSSKKLTHRSM